MKAPIAGARSLRHLGTYDELTTAPNSGEFHQNLYAIRALEETSQDFPEFD